MKTLSPLGMGKGLLKRYEVVLDLMQQRGLVKSFDVAKDGFAIVWMPGGKEKAKSLLQNRDVTGFKTTARLSLVMMIMLQEAPEWSDAFTKALSSDFVSSLRRP